MNKIVFKFLLQNKVLLTLSLLLTVLCSILNVGIAYLIYKTIEISQYGINSNDAIVMTIIVIVYLF